MLSYMKVNEAKEVCHNHSMCRDVTCEYLFTITQWGKGMIFTYFFQYYCESLSYLFNLISLKMILAVLVQLLQQIYFSKNFQFPLGTYLSSNSTCFFQLIVSSLHIPTIVSHLPVPSGVLQSLPKTVSIGFFPSATCAIYGMRLENSFVGSSPIRPVGWAPTGLKYLREIMFHFCRQKIHIYSCTKMMQ